MEMTWVLRTMQWLAMAIGVTTLVAVVALLTSS